MKRYLEANPPLELIDVIGEQGGWVKFKIINNSFNVFIGDSTHITKDILSVSEFVPEEEYLKLIQLFKYTHRKALKGALRRMGIYYD